MPIETTSIDYNSLSARFSDRGDGLLIFDWLKQGAGMTEERYELTHPGLPTACDFFTRSIHCAYGMMSEYDRETFKQNYTLEFRIIQRSFYKVPLAAIPERGVLFPWATDWQRNGDFAKIPQPGELTVPRYLAPFMPFAIVLTGQPIKVNSLSFLPVINGLMDRPVQ